MGKRKGGEKGGVALLDAVHEPSVQLALADVISSPDNPRKEFDPAQMAELKASLERDGQLTPILVLPADDEGCYELLDGERRWRALRELGLLFVEAKIRTVTNDADALFLRLVANAQRADISPLEEAEAYLQLTDAGVEVAEIAERLQKSSSHVYGRMKLLKLPAKVRDALRAGEITAGHAERLVALEDEEMQLGCLAEIKLSELSVRGLETFIKNLIHDEVDENAESSDGSAGILAGRDAGAPSDVVREAAADLEKAQSEKPLEKRAELPAGPVPDRGQANGVKLSERVKFETGVRKRILAAVIKAIDAGAALDVLETLAIGAFRDLERDDYELSVIVATVCGITSPTVQGEIGKYLVKHEYAGAARLLMACELVGFGILVDEFNVNGGRPEALLVAAKRRGVDVGECEEAEKAAVAGTSASSVVPMAAPKTKRKIQKAKAKGGKKAAAKKQKAARKGAKGAKK